MRCRRLLSYVFGLLFLASSPHAPAAPPHIVFFLVDDLGWKDAGCYGSDYYETPAIDQLAREGMRFTQAYAAHPRCVPSRYALMTGKFPARAGVPGRSYNLDPHDVTLAEALQEGGYATFFAGKWHLAKRPEQMPEAQGFDVNIAGGHAGAPGSYFFPYNKVRKKFHKTEKPIRGLDEGAPGEYLTDRLTDETLSFIRSHIESSPEQPFFAYLSHYAVHTPLEAPAGLVERYEAKKSGTTFDGDPFLEKDGTTKMHQDDATYAAMIKKTDDSLGRIMALLEELDIRERTLVVLTSDHGGLSNRGVNNQRRLATSNLPLRAGKGHLYEGGIRVPLIVAWPGVVAGGEEQSAAVNGTDHFPTLLEAAGLPLKPEQHLDGVSFLPALEGERFERSGDLFWHSPKARPRGTGDRNCTALRRGDYKLLDFYDEDRVELYHIPQDLSERANLAEQEPERAAELLQAVRSWRQEVEAFVDTAP